MSKEIASIKKILERERQARKHAEEVIEKKSLELYQANKELQKANEILEERILMRTGELREKNYELKQSKAQIDLAIESAGLGIWEWDLLQENLHFSEQIVASGGYTKEEFAKRYSSFFDLIHSKDRAYIYTKMVDHLKGKSEQFSEELRVLKKNNGYVWLYVAGKVTNRTEDGQASKLIGVYQDITEQKQFQQSLELLIKMAKTFINMPIENLDKEINDGLEIIGKYVSSDRAYIFDYDFEKSTTSNTYEWCEEGISPEIENLQGVPLEMIPQWVETHKKGEAMYIKNVQDLAKDDPLRDILEPQGIKSLLTLPIISGEEVIGFVGFDSVEEYHEYSDKERSILSFFVELLVNVRSRIQSVQQLSEAKEKAEAASKAKADFLSVMSHELRTPLNGVIGTTNLLLDTETTEEQQKLLKTLEFSGKTLMNIINDILDFSKIESGKATFNSEVFTPKRLMDSIHSSFLYKAEEKGIDFQLTCDSRMPEHLFGDSAKLLQVLNNFIGNAIKFTEEGKVSVSCKAEFKGKEEVTLHFQVSDTGIGIEESQLDHIFDSFTQAGAYINRKYGGTGLGLPIAKKLIELQKGSVEVESEYGKGSVFRFSIPFLVPKKKRKGVEVERAVNKSLYNLDGADILVVEDNPMNMMIAETFLTKWNATVHKAENGQEALDYLKSNQVDLVLMDIQMPVLDGYSTANILRKEKGADLPIIALTASTPAEVMEKVKESGMNDAITKPFDPKVLFSKLLKFLYQ